nr:DUF2961 domain-containing protein [bacterium]
NLIVRMYWDNCPHPSVEAPLLDFFCICHGRAAPLITQMLYVQDGRGFNCWFPMPFRTHARITIENDSGIDVTMLFYQVDYSLGDDIGPEDGLFHARFRRDNPCPMGQDYVLCDIEGCGQYVGTVLGVRSLYNDFWWGEGEIKAYIDSDTALPTICGTGTEDYMGSAWGLSPVQTPLQGAPVVDREAGLYSLYRFHLHDPIRFTKRLKLTIQQIGYGKIDPVSQHYGENFHQMPSCGNPPEKRVCYFERSDDYCSVSYWYQQQPHAPFADFPDRQARSCDLDFDAVRGQIKREDE